MRIKAGVLNFVLVVIMVIAVISTLLFIYLRYAAIEIQVLSNSNKTIHNAFSGVEYGLSLSDPENDFNITVNPFTRSNDSVKLNFKYWGGYNLIYSTSAIQSSVSGKIAMVGSNPVNFSRVSLILEDTNIPLSITGNTKISGSTIIPDEGIKSAYFNRRPYLNEKLLYGPSRTSDSSIVEFLNYERLEYWYNEMNKINQVDFYNELNYFQDTLKISYSSDAIQLVDTIQGYQVIKSAKEIVVSANAKLNFIILNAPKVTIESGFTGNLQAFAADTLIVENDVRLNYPSILCLLSDNLDSYLSIGDAKILGEIIHHIEIENIHEFVQLNNYITKEADLTGSFYFKGYTMLEGKIKGNLMVDRFIKVDSMRNSTYINYLVDVEIDARNDSSTFVNSYFFNFSDRNKKVAWLK